MKKFTLFLLLNIGNFGVKSSKNKLNSALSSSEKLPDMAVFTELFTFFWSYVKNKWILFYCVFSLQQNRFSLQQNRFSYNRTDSLYNRTDSLTTEEILFTTEQILLQQNRFSLQQNLENFVKSFTKIKKKTLKNGHFHGDFSFFLDTR